MGEWTVSWPKKKELKEFASSVGMDLNGVHKLINWELASFPLENLWSENVALTFTTHMNTQVAHLDLKSSDNDKLESRKKKSIRVHLTESSLLQQ